MASVDIEAPAELAEYLARVRSDTDSLTWVVFAYKEGGGNALELAGSGEGGLAEFREAFDENRRMYGMCRLLDYYDGHQTVKFVFVVWAGARVGVIKKARMATHKGSIQELMGQAHLTIDASDAADLADEAVMTRITDASGSGSRVLAAGAPARGASVPPSAPSASTAAEVPSVSVSASVSASASASVPAARAVGEPQAGAGGAKSVPAVPRGGGELELLEREEVAAALARVRNDSDAADWMLLSYEGKSNRLRLAGSGSGGVEALKEHLEADNASYGIVRVNDVFDGHKTVKFVLILWLGEKVRVVRKAKIATHKGEVLEVVGQYHTDISASSLDELTHEDIMSKVMDASGSGVRTLDVGAKPRGAPQTRQTAAGAGGAGKAPSVPRSAGGELNLMDPEQMQAAIQCVRNDNDSADWVLLGYEGQTNNFALINVGEGGVEALKENLADDNVSYGIVRVTDQIDGHITVKFVLIIWIGERVKIMRKAKTATHKGEILKVVGQYHTDVVVSDKNELTFEEIMRKVKDASGTADHVC